MKNNRLRDKLVVILGGTALVLFVILSWLPRDCSVIRKASIGCPSIPIQHKTLEEIETDRIPHQEAIDDLIHVDVKGQADRGDTRITFFYRTEPGTTAYLGIVTKDGTIPLATITNPLIPTDWYTSSSAAPDTTLFTRNSLTDGTIASYLKGKPRIVADSIAAANFSLKSSEYTQVAKATSLDTYDAMLLSYIPQQKDGTWSQFEQHFDLSSYPLDTNQHLLLSVNVQRSGTQSPLLLGEVHVDYRK